MINRTEDVSYPESPGTWSTAFTMAGASQTTVARSAAIASSTATGSKARSTTRAPPTCSVGRPGRSSPPTW
jgi:hypothetical protein